MDTIDITIPPDGRTLPFRVLPIGSTWVPQRWLPRLWARLSGYERGSFYFLGLIERFQDGDLGALRRLLKEFPAAVHQPALCYLMPIELVKAAGDFFGAVRPLRPAAPPAADGPSPSTSA